MNPDKNWKLKILVNIIKVVQQSDNTATVIQHPVTQKDTEEDEVEFPWQTKISIIDHVNDLDNKRIMNVNPITLWVKGGYENQSDWEKLNSETKYLEYNEVFWLWPRNNELGNKRAQKNM